MVVTGFATFAPVQRGPEGKGHFEHWLATVRSRGMPKNKTQSFGPTGVDRKGLWES